MLVDIQKLQQQNYNILHKIMKIESAIKKKI